MSDSRAGVVIIGGGIVGACTAYFLKASGYSGSVIAIERDPTYRFASTTLSAASIRTQFSHAGNVRMSLFGVQFIRSLKERFGPEADIGFHEGGYLILAGRDGAAALATHHRMQTAEGADVALLMPPELAARFPWLNTADLGAGGFGRSNEGWFDAHALLTLVRKGAIGLGARFLHDEAVAIDTASGAVRAVRTAKGERIAAGHVVNAAGPSAARVAAMAGIDLPVEARKRTAFMLRAPLDGAGMPLLLDHSGAWIRPEGTGFIAGIAPDPADDPAADGDFEPDMDLLEAKLWPALAHRIPALEQLRVQRAWAGHYEMSVLDHNAIIGPHPDLPNFIFANGFSGHGVQHGPATGRGVAELIMLGGYASLDLSAFGYERVAAGRPMPEDAIY